MPPHGGHGHGGHGHGGHHGGGHRRGRGGGSFGPGWGWGGGGYWDYPGTELVVIDDDDRDKERIARYLASLPEKERAAAFAKIYGGAVSGIADDAAAFLKSPVGLIGIGFAAYLLFFRKRGRR